MKSHTHGNLHPAGGGGYGREVLSEAHLQHSRRKPVRIRPCPPAPEAAAGAIPPNLLFWLTAGKDRPPGEGKLPAVIRSNGVWHSLTHRDKKTGSIPVCSTTDVQHNPESAPDQWTALQRTTTPAGASVEVRNETAKADHAGGDSRERPAIWSIGAAVALPPSKRTTPVRIRYAPPPGTDGPRQTMGFPSQIPLIHS